MQLIKNGQLLVLFEINGWVPQDIFQNYRFLKALVENISFDIYIFYSINSKYVFSFFFFFFYESNMCFLKSFLKKKRDALTHEGSLFDILTKIWTTLKKVVGPFFVWLGQTPLPAFSLLDD